jgi:transcriptional regulator with XRE-family HTH domain
MVTRSALAKRVRTARREARLAQVQLGKLLGVSQTVVSLAENGVSRIGDRYVRSVLKACGLLADVADEAATAAKDQPAEGYVVGLDPETLEVVRRGSKRDEELRQKYVFWSNGYVAG